MRLLSWLLALPFAAAAIVFAVSNLHSVHLELWPLPFTVDVPVYIAVLGPLAVGMIVGGIIVWLAGGRHRRLARQNRRRAEQLERQLEGLRQPAPHPAQGSVVAPGSALPQP